MATVSGFVEKIKYRNEENGYSVLSVASEGEEYILVGTFASVEEGEYLSASGVMKLHPVYGEQLSVESYEIRIPEDRESILRYLSSGAVKGVGKTLAKRIVKKFKNDTLRILEEEPERLAEVKGISERIAAEIGAQIEEKQEQRKAVLFLTRYGISMQLGRCHRDRLQDRGRDRREGGHPGGLGFPRALRCSLLPEPGGVPGKRVPAPGRAQGAGGAAPRHRGLQA